MVSGTRYRAASVAGAVSLTVFAVSVANQSTVQRTATTVIPVFNQLQATTLTGRSYSLAVVTALVAVLLASVPLFKPRPRRILDTISLSLNRVLIASLTLATVGYFDYTYRLPRSTLVLTTAVLLGAMPVWFVAIRRRPMVGSERAVIIGDDPGEIAQILEAANLPIVGYVSPPNPYHVEGFEGLEPRRADGSGLVAKESRLDDVRCLGGLSRLDDILVEYDIDTAVFAFTQHDRAEFFGALAACHDHGVTAKIHRRHADTVLVDAQHGRDLVDIDVEPWDWQDRVFKRAFDIAFAGIGLLAAAPVIAVISAAIKLDSPGPVLYSQQRTAAFGETFTIYKFRSMTDGAETDTGAVISEEDAGSIDPRVTRVGRVLRRTHLDEIPQLWSILVGDMSVVGPRPERPALDTDIKSSVSAWRRRWFVRPGLTGLAQINEVTGHDPERKLEHDVAYIHRQSFQYDVKIVIRQVWLVLVDVAALLRP